MGSMDHALWAVWLVRVVLDLTRAHFKPLSTVKLVVYVQS